MGGAPNAATDAESTCYYSRIHPDLVRRGMEIFASMLLRPLLDGISFSLRAGEIVGLIFDGNIESLVGDFVYEGGANRAVAVHTAGMTEALRKLYGADKVVNELLTGAR